MNASASPSLFPQVPNRSFVFCDVIWLGMLASSSDPRLPCKVTSAVLPVSVLVGTDELLVTGGVIVLELFPFCLPEVGGLVGTEGLLPDDRLSGVAVRLFDLLRNVFRSESFEPLLRLLFKGDRLLCAPLGLA